MTSIINDNKEQHNRIAIVDQFGTYTYKQLNEQAQVIAKNIISLTGNAEGTVLFMVPSGFEYVEVLWGIWLAGKIAVPLHTAHPLDEIKYLAEDTAASLFIADSVFLDKAKQATSSDCKLLSVGEISKANCNASLPAIDPEQDALIIYTSGTTGKPKGVVMSHLQIETQVKSLTQAWAWCAADRTLNVLPMHHVHGLINITCCAMYNGAVLEMQPTFDAAFVRERMLSGELSLFMAVPTIYHKLIQHYEQLSAAEQAAWTKAMQDMRLMVSGSAALPISVLQKWETISGHRLLERYGMSEIGMALSNPLQGERKPGFVGRPLPFVAAKIVQEDGVEVTEHSVAGELYVSGPTVFKRYWQRPEETQKAFDGKWFKTGDIVERDADGDYKILGRNSSDIIKSGGYKISALEIENLILEHPNVLECAVIALPSEEWGEVVAAVVVGDTSLDELKEWTKQKLAHYKTPRHWQSLKTLPRNAMGKVVKKELKSLFE